MNIVSDNPAGVVGFEIQNTDSEVINESGDEGAANEVEIDLGEASASEVGDTGASGSGVNVGSVVNVGTIDRTDGTNSEPSLKIINQSTSDDVEFTFDFNSVSGSDLGSSKLNLLFEFQDPSGNVESVLIDGTGSSNSITSADGTANGSGSNLSDLNNLDAGEAYDFALRVDADGAPATANVSLDLDITAVTP
ncbi:MAG: hypothetical protein A07HB70_01777 [uncultured archaeon A07HB70]|nr:MAG: hypothetical protein A07HB70_01777 [uncultured archaeon A07HB70]